MEKISNDYRENVRVLDGLLGVGRSCDMVSRDYLIGGRRARLWVVDGFVRKKSAISADIPLFTLQGNFDVKKLHGVYRLMMEIMVKTAGKGLAEKKDRTPEEDDMLAMMRCGGERVKEENLGAVLDWYSAQR